MRLWTLIKLVAGAVVLGITVFTGLLVWHVRGEPLGGIFSQLVPVKFDPEPIDTLPQADSTLPEIDPGAKVFERARELIAIGDLAGARDRLRTVVSIYPRSKAAPEARRIVGEMNLDDLLSASHMEGKEIHIVRPGESYLGIAAKYDTTLDCIMHLNGLLDLKGLHPGDELIVMPLRLRVMIEPGRKVLSLWDGGRFVKEYPMLAVDLAGLRGGLQTKISSKSGISGNRRVTPGMKEYRNSEKTFSLEKSSLQIRPLDPTAPRDDEEDLSPGSGFHLAVEDVEELALLLRPGNEVEIRPAAP
ncbi:LysM peptidoglycan-binding domain-containing protein [Luteolibacter marinus]|uniref:LysM peptidoglycan-binding domain-containing protein n=1 Tax=Luteolibacter marinus TaxID=2776705 RepID=UPI0018690752|nr:LysM domain-containing protein [Luteolibacter marinus]